jgi:hypothetical protein
MFPGHPREGRRFSGAPPAATPPSAGTKRAALGAGDARLESDREGRSASGRQDASDDDEVAKKLGVAEQTLYV